VHMSAFGGKADVTIGTCPSANDPSGHARVSLVANFASTIDAF